MCSEGENLLQELGTEMLEGAGGGKGARQLHLELGDRRKMLLPQRLEEQSRCCSLEPVRVGYCGCR